MNVPVVTPKLVILTFLNPIDYQRTKYMKVTWYEQGAKSTKKICMIVLGCWRAREIITKRYHEIPVYRGTSTSVDFSLTERAMLYGP